MSVTKISTVKMLIDALGLTQVEFAKYLKFRFAGSWTIGCRSEKNKTTWFSGKANFFCKSIVWRVKRFYWL